MTSLKTAILFLTVFCSIPTRGATYNAATANRADVQSAANFAINADTVFVPSGTVIWTTNIVLFQDIYLIGSGIGSTVITDAAPRSVGDAELISWTANTSGKCLLTGFSFYGTNGQSNPNTGVIELQGNCFMFRVCSNLFSVNNRGIQWHGWIYGVYDHNTNILNFTQAIEHWEDAYGGGQFGDLSWLDPDFSGTTNGLYVETSSFYEQSMNSPGAVDCMGGGRIIFRYNVLTNCPFTTHGTESTGRQRSIRWFENYGNFQYQGASGFSSAAGQYRGGTGVDYNNNLFGPDYQYYRQLSCYREIYSFLYWGVANGTNGYDTNFTTIYASGTHTGLSGSQVLSDAAANFTPNIFVGTNILWNVTQGWAALITANTANTITPTQLGTSVTGGPNLTFNTGDSYQVRAVVAAIDQPGRGQQSVAFNAGTAPATPQQWQGEALDPVYAWQNRINGALVGIGSGYPSVLEGRDFFNTPKSGYTPLVYPHPLTTSSPLRLNLNGTPIQEVRIQTNGTYSAFIVDQGGTTNLNLFCYDRVGNTSYVPLSGTGITPLNFAHGEISFTTNGNLCLLSTGNGVKTARLWEWSLDNPGGLPHTATLVTTFDLGATNVDSPFMVTMKNGSVVGGFSLHQAGNFVFPIYRFGATGLWTNYGQTDLGSVFPSGLPSTFLTAAEQPQDNSLFIFKTEDGGQVINSAQFSVTNGLAKMTNGVCAINLLTNSVTCDANNEPYGEICTVQSLSDWNSNRIVIAFNNNHFNGTGFNFDRATQVSVTGVQTNFSLMSATIPNYQFAHQVIWATTNLTNQIVREFSSIMPTIYPYSPNGVTLRWYSYNTNNQTGTGTQWPLIKQSKVSGAEQTASPPLAQSPALFNVNQFFPYNGDFTYQDISGWHLLIDPANGPPVPGPPTLLPILNMALMGNATITGNASKQ